MAVTTFTVSLLQDIYEFPYGFFVDINSTGDMVNNETPIGVDGNDDERGFWVDLKRDFTCEGDVAVDGSKANLLNKYLISESFAFNPSNPPYNTVAPYLKDGVTPNGKFDNSENPVAMVEQNPAIGAGLDGGNEVTTNVYRTMQAARRFAVATTVA